ncbi:hypothetical protein H3J60_004549 [Salmonella enterica]|nr:hypothetical protein [Salmonella enterica]
MNDADYILNPFTGEREEPRYSKSWYDQKSEALISLVLKHVLALHDDDWQDLRENASKSDSRCWIPIVQDYSQNDIITMSREYVVRKSCVWMGIGKADMSLPSGTLEQIGVLEDQPVLFEPRRGAYYWLETESDELVTITLSYPIELY